MIEKTPGKNPGLSQDGPKTRIVVSPDRIVQELLRIAMADPARAHDKDGNLLSIHEIPEDVRRAVSEIEVNEIYESRGEERRKVGVVRKVKFFSKTHALKVLRRLGVVVARPLGKQHRELGKKGQA